MKKFASIIVFLSGLFLAFSTFVSAATILYPIGGGLGTSTAPSYGQIPVGNSSGVYVLTATSSLGLTTTGATYSFTPTNNYATNTSATSTPIWGRLGLYASSTSHLVDFDFQYATGTGMHLSGSSSIAWLNSASSSIDVLAVPNLTSALLLTNGNGLFAEYAGTSCTNQFVRSLSALGVATCASVATTDFASANVSQWTNDAGYQTYIAFPSGATSTPLSFTGKLTITSATTTYLSIGNDMVYPRWNDRMSIPDATTTDEGYKFGSCLESGGHSVTIDKVDSFIASTSPSAPQNHGITWNFYIAALTSTTSPMKLFSASTTSSGTSSVQTVSSGFSTATIPAGYCFWWVPHNASSSQIKQLYINLWGKEN